MQNQVLERATIAVFMFMQILQNCSLKWQGFSVKLQLTQIFFEFGQSLVMVCCKEGPCDYSSPSRNFSLLVMAFVIIATLASLRRVGNYKKKTKMKIILMFCYGLKKENVLSRSIL